MRLIQALLFLVLLIGNAVVAHAGNSNSLMDVSPDGTRLLVANTDSGTVTVVDLEKRAKLYEIPVGDHPEGVTWIGNGPLAAVTVYREDKVFILDANQGRVFHRMDVDDEPYGIVADRAGRRAWVTHDYPGCVCEIDLEARKVIRKLAVGPFLRGIALSPDESRLFVTEFHTGRLHAIDIAKWAVVDSWPGQKTDNLSRNVVIHPNRPKAYLSHLRSITDVINARGSIFPQLSVCDLAPATPDKDGKIPKRRTSIPLDTFNEVYIVTNPWEAAVSPDGKRIYTIYAGTDDMNVSSVIDDGYKEIQRMGSAVTVGKNPRAVRVSPDGENVFIYNALDFNVGIYQADGMKLLATVATTSPPKTEAWVRGKVLFNSGKQPMTSARWIACSSCHPDGGNDGRVWQNPEGLRRTTSFFGLAHTHPIHWSADRDEVQDFEYTIRSKLMQGRGLFPGTIKPRTGFQPVELDEHMAGKSKDLDALAVYCNSFSFTLSPHIPAPGKLSESAQRGKAIFFSAETKCATCHSGPYYTDSSLKKPFNLHDVGTGQDDPSEKMGPKYDTPTLLGVYRLTSYLHHGKAKSLKEVLTAFNRKDQHGKTSHLSQEQIDDLVAFLDSLPYEPPPEETPNTVKDRVVPKKE
ncbi:MAG TPA: c-type cytochrome [Gemmataceae bacterium]|nr:c-type cytochrome [Gemmataceae bacterium]